MDELIRKEDVIRALTGCGEAPKDEEIIMAIDKMPSPIHNAVNLCDSCDHEYPDCPSDSKDDIIFGDGVGNDNICACRYYTPKNGKVAQWFINPDGYYPYCSNCKNEPRSGDMTDYCPSCGAFMGKKKI